MNPLCRYCGYEYQIEASNCVERSFCSVSCRHSYNQYEKQVRTLHYRLVNKIYSKSESIRVRKYHKKDKADKILQEMLI